MTGGIAYAGKASARRGSDRARADGKRCVRHRERNQLFDGPGRNPWHRRGIGLRQEHDRAGADGAAARGGAGRRVDPLSCTDVGPWRDRHNHPLLLCGPEELPGFEQAPESRGLDHAVWFVRLAFQATDRHADLLPQAHAELGAGHCPADDLGEGHLLAVHAQGDFVDAPDAGSSAEDQCPEGKVQDRSETIAAGDHGAL